MGSYQLPLAYLLVGAAFIVASFVFVFYGLYREVRRSAVAFEVGEFKVSRLCFAGYDHRYVSLLLVLGCKVASGLGFTCTTCSSRSVAGYRVAR